MVRDNMKIEHIAVYSAQLEEMKEFYVRYFDGVPNNKYHNPRTGMSSYFIQFSGETRLEIMSLPELAPAVQEVYRMGLTHLAFSLGSKEEVDRLTALITGDGYELLSAARTTGDGYYESCVADPDGNRIELTV